MKTKMDVELQKGLFTSIKITEACASETADTDTCASETSDTDACASETSDDEIVYCKRIKSNNTKTMYLQKIEKPEGFNYKAEECTTEIYHGKIRFV
jgi:hypothetical protein